jgi:hypothetical protein
MAKKNNIDEPVIDEDTGLTEEEQILADAVKADEERIRILNGLAKKIEDEFEKRAVARLPKELEWDQSQRLYDSPLSSVQSTSPDKPYGDAVSPRRRPTPNIVRTKCDTAIANSVSMQFAAGEKNWDLFPAPNTSDPQVTEACRMMEKEIETQLLATKYALQCRRAIEERVILGTGVIKGPVNTGKPEVRYEKLGDGTWVPTVTDNKQPKTEWVTIWRFYPDMSVSDFAECSDTIELHPMTPLELSQYRNHPGFDKDAIDKILTGGDMTGPIKPDTYNERFSRFTTDVWSKSPYLYRNRYQILEYHGPVTYDELTKLGLEPTYESPTKEYFGEVWVCCGQVIRMELENIEGYYETPYCLAVWKRDPSSPFGYGHPLLLADPQRVVTQAYHMILDNASLTSGPQVAMYKKYIQPADGTYEISPNKVWLLSDPSARIDDAIKFFSPQNVIGNIMPVLQLARQFAEEESATSAMAAGLGSPDNVESATGQLIMKHSSTTLLDFLAEEWDDQVTEKIIRRYHAWNMQYNPDPKIKGDYIIDVKSSTEYKNKQMYVRDVERLSMEVAQNPQLAMAINVDELAKARLKMMHLPSNRIIKSPEEYAAAVQAAQQQPDPKMIELQMKAKDGERADRELQLKAAELKFRNTSEQRRAEMDHDERMAANFARIQEAQASVIRARSEVQREMIQAAQKDKVAMTKLLNDKEMKTLALHADIFMNSIQDTRKAQDQLLTEQELQYANKNGKGI